VSDSWNQGNFMHQYPCARGSNLSGLSINPIVSQISSLGPSSASEDVPRSAQNDLSTPGILEKVEGTPLANLTWCRHPNGERTSNRFSAIAIVVIIDPAWLPHNLSGDRATEARSFV
jgi:hypothetical protein